MSESKVVGEMDWIFYFITFSQYFNDDEFYYIALSLLIYSILVLKGSILLFYKNVELPLLQGQKC